MRKIYLVPNLVTTANLFCGFYSLICTVKNEPVQAAWALVAASVFDALDGRIARLAKATSEFGVQYDSLSDLVSFGVGPGFLLYSWALSDFGRIGFVASFLFLVCGALRLARFNVTSEILPKGLFQGLPIPGGAGLVSTFVIFSESMKWSVESFRFPLLIATFLISGLMISSIPFPSFKELNWRSKGSFGLLLMGVLSLVLIALRPDVMLFVVLSGYVISCLVWNSFRALRKGSTPKVA